MNARFVVALATASFAATGCSELQKRSYSPLMLPAAEVIRVPLLNVEAEAEIGTSMISSAKRISSPGITLANTITHDGTHMGYPYGLTIPRGPLYAAATDATGTFYQAFDTLDFRNTNGSITKVRGGLFVPSAAPAATEIYWLAPNSPGTPLNDDHPGIRFTKGMVDLWGTESFKRELVYGGVSQNTVTVLYREFVNDMARPAFSQELKYDLAKGDVIGYRGARFQVLGVTNTGVKYRVLKHLE
jgi:hypothetical protein